MASCDIHWFRGASTEEDLIKLAAGRGRRPFGNCWLRPFEAGII